MPVTVTFTSVKNKQLTVALDPSKAIWFLVRKSPFRIYPNPEVYHLPLKLRSVWASALFVVLLIVLVYNVQKMKMTKMRRWRPTCGRRHAGSSSAHTSTRRDWCVSSLTPSTSSYRCRSSGLLKIHRRLTCRLRRSTPVERWKVLWVNYNNNEY